jgi:hypothetical protein
MGTHGYPWVYMCPVGPHSGAGRVGSGGVGVLALPVARPPLACILVVQLAKIVIEIQVLDGR